MDKHTYAIEIAVVNSIIDANWNEGDDRIRKYNLPPEIFTNKNIRYLVKIINRMRELNLPIDENTIYKKLEKANAMTFELESAILDVITSNSFAAYGTFKKYVDHITEDSLKSQHKDI